MGNNAKYKASFRLRHGKTYLGKLCSAHPGLDGLRRGATRTCVECERERKREYNRTHSALHVARNRVWRVAHRDTARAQQKRYRLKHPDRVREYRRIWRATNVSRVRKVTQRYVSANRERYNANSRRWSASHKEKVRIATNRRYTCVYCFRSFTSRLKATIDHRVPLSRGGDNWPENIHAVCGRCNSSKGVKTHPEMLATLWAKVGVDG